MSPQDLSEITPSNLSAGHGDNACLFLNLIADVALQKHCKTRAMVYPSDTVEGSTGATGVVEDEDEDDGFIGVC